MKKLLCMALALALLLPSLALAAEAGDYTMAGKLMKQLWAGSGFSGTLALEIAAQAGAPAQTLVTQSPVELQWDYIYVRPSGQIQEERRVDLRLMDGETVQTSAHLQLLDGSAAVQLDALGADWYTLPFRALGGGAAAGSGQESLLSSGLDQLYSQTGIPALLGALTPMLLAGSRESTPQLTALWDSYITRMDLWIEGYRQSTQLGKQEDGTGTMELAYTIKAANIKSQLKQMLLELLSDTEALPALQTWLGGEYAALYLNPEYQPYYFAVIDALPLDGDLTIGRTVSMKGETLALHLSLPFYDAKGGAVTLRYDRVRGAGDLPDENTLSLESAQRQIALNYLEYSSMTDVTVLQGTLYSATTAEFAVAEDAAAEKPLALAFTLRRQQAEGKDTDDQDTYSESMRLTLSPDPDRDAAAIYAFDELDLALEASFASQTLKTAPTEVNATLTVSGENRPQTLTLTLNGKTRKQWTPEALPATPKDLSAMTGDEQSAALKTVAVNIGALLLPHISFTAGNGAAPTESAQPAGDSTAPTGSAQPAGPEVTPGESAQP